MRHAIRLLTLQIGDTASDQTVFPAYSAPGGQCDNMIVVLTLVTNPVNGNKLGAKARATLISVETVRVLPGHYGLAGAVSRSARNGLADIQQAIHRGVCDRRRRGPDSSTLSLLLNFCLNNSLHTLPGLKEATTASFHFVTSHFSPYEDCDPTAPKHLPRTRTKPPAQRRLLTSVLYPVTPPHSPCTTTY